MEEKTFFTSDQWSAPGKVFLWGEYGVLFGVPAVLAALRPRFSLSFVSPATPEGVSDKKEENSKTQQKDFFSPLSPVGRLKKWALENKIPVPEEMVWTDPYQGKGGWGASTAQFLLFFKKIYPHLSSWEIWDRYQELMKPQTGFPPSGGDLLCQIEGGICLFDSVHRKMESIFSLFPWSSFFIFSTTDQNPARKVKTHEHLESVVFSSPDKMKKSFLTLFYDAFEALQQKDPLRFARAFNAYRYFFSEKGIHDLASWNDCLALEKVPGVLAVKGAGSLQADTIIVFVDLQTLDHRLLDEVAHERQLTLFSKGIPYEKGVENISPPLSRRDTSPLLDP